MTSALLVLFDVDGTILLSHDELYVQANAAALSEVYGVGELEHPDDPGDTALHYTRLVLHAAGLDDATIDAGADGWCAAISRRYLKLLANADTSGWQVAAEAEPAIARITHRALLTGNPEPIARARLERIGLAHLFPDGQGAFGCEAEDRVRLIELARRRANNWPAERTVAVGDTPRDVDSAHRAGIRCVAVKRVEGADAVISELVDLPDALARLS